MRAKKSGGGVTTYYLRGQQNELLTEWQINGQTTSSRDYVYAGTRLIAAVRRTVPGSSSAIAIVPNGPAETVAIIGTQEQRLTFSAISGHRYSVYIEVVSSSGCLTSPLQVLEPDGTTVAASTSPCGSALLEPFSARVSGTYFISIRGSNGSSGTLRVHLYDVVDLTATVPPNGAPVTVTLTIPGQKLRVRFNGVQGKRYAVYGEGLAGGNCLFSPFTLFAPSGATVYSIPSGCGNPFVNPQNGPETGQYTVLVDPLNYQVGTVRVSVYDVVDLTSQVTPDGTSVSYALTRGQALRLAFAGLAGHRYAVFGEVIGAGSGCLFFPLSLTKPDNVTVLSTKSQCGNAFLEPAATNTTGTHTVLVDPMGPDIGTARISVYDVVDLTGTLAVNATATPVSIMTPGQNARFTFTVATSQPITVRATASVMGVLTVKLVRSDDSVVTSVTSSSGSFNLSQQMLAPGTYAVIIDPNSTSTGTMNIQVTNP